MKIALIGAGNVATHLGIALKEAGHEIVYVYSRSMPSAVALGEKLATSFGKNIKLIPKTADLYIICVSDQAIKSVLKEFPYKKKAIVHTSGSVSINVFGKNYPNSGVLYPVQTFTKGRLIKFRLLPLFIEAKNQKTLRVIKKVADSLSLEVEKINSNDRKAVHLAAVVAANFTNHLLFHAEKILAKRGIPLDFLWELMDETVSKAMVLSPAPSQTGPAKRGDAEIINEHLKMLKNEPRLKEIYQLITKSIEETSGTRL